MPAPGFLTVESLRGSISVWTSRQATASAKQRYQSAMATCSFTAVQREAVNGREYALFSSSKVLHEPPRESRSSLAQD